MNRPDKTCPGFTLIEMLVALAVVAIALAAISSNFISYFDSTSHLRDNTIARWIAENQLVKTRIEYPWPALGTNQGTLRYAGANWSWEQVVRTSPDKDFRQVEIQVSKKPVAGESSSPLFKLVGYARNPKPGKLVIP